MKRLLIALAAALAFATPAVATPSAADLAAIAAYEAKVGPAAAAKPLTARMAELKVPGVSIAFIENGEIKWTRTYGVAEAGKARAITPTTGIVVMTNEVALVAAYGWGEADPATAGSPRRAQLVPPPVPK